MKTYGHFDDTNREYVIERPDTPLPWINYIGQDEFFGICSHTGGGYTFWKDARMRRLTRYRYNTAPKDTDGRLLYIRNNDEVWSPSWKPCRVPLDRYECRHGLGYTKISSAKNGIACDTLFFVPTKENLELWQVTLSNETDQEQEVKLYSYVEFCFYEALVDMTNYQRSFSIGEVEVEDNLIFHKTEYRERRNHYTLFGCTEDISGFDTERDDFLGVHNSTQDPLAVTNGKCSNSVAHGWNPVGAQEITVKLKPGEKKSCTFILAYVENDKDQKFDSKGLVNKTKAYEIVEKYKKEGAVENAFNKLKSYWDDILKGCQVNDLPHEDMQRMVNTWTPYQCMATFNLSRSASGFETGIGRGMGFRDSNQDLLGFVHMIPGRARERILDLAATQLSDGMCFHQYQPLTKKGNAEIGGGFNDDPLWMVLSTCAYIRETGDKGILDEIVGFEDKPDAQTTLLEHLEISIAYTLRERGPHKLPLIGHADWNDCLNLNCFSDEPNESFQCAGDISGSTAESLMIAGLFLYVMQDFSSLYSFLNREEDAKRIDGYYDEMLDAVETHGWDGEWYLRAFDNDSNPIGSHKNEEGQIYIESQGWLLMGGAGRNNGRAAKTLESVHQRLYSKGNGIALIDPSYSKYHRELGEITSYPPGYKENGGIFSHNNTWVQIACAMLGESERAVEYWESICPSMKEDYDLYKSEPYVLAQTTSSQHSPKVGEAKNSWLTGTAAWTYVSAVYYILGIRPEYNGLRIDPAIPADWDGYSFVRKYRNSTYSIKVHNPNKTGRGVSRVTVDGQAIEGNLVPISDSAKEFKVDVYLV